MTWPRRRTPPASYCSARPLACSSIVCRVSASTNLITCQATTPSTKAEPTTLRPKMTNVSLNAVARKSLLRVVTQHVSSAAHGMQQRRVEISVDFGPQPRHVDVDNVGLRIEVIVPDVLEQHSAGHHLAGVLHQIFEQAKLARLLEYLMQNAGKVVTRTM